MGRLPREAIRNSSEQFTSSLARLTRTGECRLRNDDKWFVLSDLLASMLNSYRVQQFVIEREIPGAGALSDAEIRDITLKSLQALGDMGQKIQWLHSYVTEDKVYCVYLAPDEDCIREHARRAGIPADRVSAVRRLIDPARFK